MTVLSVPKTPFQIRGVYANPTVGPKLLLSCFTFSVLSNWFATVSTTGYLKKFAGWPKFSYLSPTFKVRFSFAFHESWKKYA